MRRANRQRPAQPCNWNDFQDMKTVRLHFLGLFVYSWMTVSCLASESASVVRILINKGGNEYTYRVNTNKSVSIKAAALTNALKSFNLKHGDVVIMNLPKTKDPSPERERWYWISSSCASNQEALYLGDSSTLPDISVYHWNVPSRGTAESR